MFGAIGAFISVASAGYSLIRQIMKDLEEDKETHWDREAIREHWKKLPKKDRHKWIMEVVHEQKRKNGKGK